MEFLKRKSKDKLCELIKNVEKNIFKDGDLKAKFLSFSSLDILQFLKNFQGENQTDQKIFFERIENEYPIFWEKYINSPEYKKYEFKSIWEFNNWESNLKF